MTDHSPLFYPEKIGLADSHWEVFRQPIASGATAYSLAVGACVVEGNSSLLSMVGQNESAAP
jgi:hypothetical protein